MKLVSTPVSPWEWVSGLQAERTQPLGMALVQSGLVACAVWVLDMLEVS